jgi:hypothetical protein
MATTSSLLNEDPILARLSAQSIIKMFESDLNYALKAIRLKGQSNQQRLLNQSLLQKCWDKFSAYLSRIYLATRIIESGEYLMSTESMHNVCDFLCFSKFLVEFPIPESTAPDCLEWTALHHRASLGQTMASFVRILIMDPCLQSKRGAEETESVLINLLNVMDTCNASEDLAPLVLAGSHHVRYVVEHLSKTENYKLVSLFENNTSKSLTLSRP